MASERIRQHRLQYYMQSIGLLLAVVSLAGIVGFLLAGTLGIVFSLVAVAVGLMAGRRVPTRLLMAMLKARPVAIHEAPWLHRTIRDLASRAGLRQVPDLYYVASMQPNAFAMGREQDAGLAVTDGVLRLLDRRQLRGVLAHEISHIANGDLWLLQLSQGLRLQTQSMGNIGLLLLLLNLPLLLLGGLVVPWGLVLVLLVAPGLSGLLHLALSRVREFDADLTAVSLTGDPAGLAQALRRLDGGPWWQRLLRGQIDGMIPAALRTHPATEARIARLLELAPRSARASPGLLATW